MSGKRRLRVLQLGKFYAPHKGGMETYLQCLCEELRNFVDLRVIVASDGPHDSEETIGNVPVTRVGTLFNMAATPICPGMVRKIRETRADVVHIHYPNPAAILAYLASHHTGQLVVAYHSDIVRQKVLKRGFEPIMHRVLSRSAALIADSPNLVETSEVLSHYRDRCHVIPYGVRLQEFDGCAPSAVRAIRDRFGSRLILSVGRLVYYKGYRHLIEAMEKVDGRLLIIGDGPLRGELEGEIAARNLSGRVTLLGEIEDLLPYYHAADVFVLPSVAPSEAFGIVQVEAMACGKPVVNTALASGVPYVSVHGVTGLTVPPANAEGLATAISLLLDDPDLRARYGHAARRRVQHEFSLSGMAERTFQLYHEVLSNQASGARQLVPESRNGLRATGEA